MDPMEKNNEVPYILKMKKQQKSFEILHKILNQMEHYLEKLATSNSEWINTCSKLNLATPYLCILHIYSVVFISRREADSSEADFDALTNLQLAIPFTFNVFHLLIGTLFVSIDTSSPYWEYRTHFTDIGCGKKVFKMILFSCFVYFAASVPNGLTLLDVYAIFGLFLSCILGFLLHFVQAQRSTKLRFDPCESNHLFTLLSWETKDKGLIRILDSSIFKITIKNVGSQPWNSINCELNRCSRDEYTVLNFRTPLPVFTLFPQEQIELVPESFRFDGKCIRVPHLHCFGSIDREVIVQTVICNARKNSKIEETWKEVCYGNKIAEHIANYEERKVEEKLPTTSIRSDNEEWESVNVCYPSSI